MKDGLSLSEQFGVMKSPEANSPAQKRFSGLSTDCDYNG
jgi:hypothetical protein